MGAHARERQIAQKRGLERLEGWLGARVDTPLRAPFWAHFWAQKRAQKSVHLYKKDAGFRQKGPSKTGPFLGVSTPPLGVALYSM